ncbi:hypothetical protein ACPPVT_04525 [Angustibacter sp. McL0619]|uniref:hypothetical protein n=1 Tax=Angustibacter sp. McL0619 TaxID=3415676 RepID=UPI003CF89794
MTAAGEGRTEFVDEMLELLWPAPESARRVRARRSQPGSRDLVMIPGARAPHLLVPLTSRAATARVIDSWGRAGSPQRRLAGSVLSWGVRLGLAGLLTADRVRVPGAGEGSLLERHLSEVVGCPVSLTVIVTRARANRKPVLQLVDQEGVVRAFVKVGTDELTRGLVQAETTALRSVSGVSSVRVPQVLAAGGWNGLELLVLSPLDLAAAQRVRDLTRWEPAMREVSRIGGVTREPWLNSQYRSSLHSRVHLLAEARAGRLAAALAQVDRCLHDQSLLIGSWHGDWATWNCGATDGTGYLWDWERFASGVPVGYDAAHFLTHQTLLDPALETAALVPGYSAALAPVLARLGVPEAQAKVVTLLYLVEIAVRYLTDGQDEVGNVGAVLEGMIDGIVAASRQLVEEVA